ncbi:glycoside hydrolase family 25 protein [Flavobacterium sp. U410]
MTKRNYTSTRNYKTKTSGKTKGIGFYLFILIAFLSISAFGFYFRDGFLYYFGFKSNKDELSHEERKITDIRIYEVLSSHTNHEFGFDVSEYQYEVDWEGVQVLEDTFQLSFAFIRATAGQDKIDTQFKRNWKKSKENGFLRGAYHYYRPNENSIKQAENFIKTVHLQKGDLPPVLDIEKLPKKQSLDSLKKGLRRWLVKVEQHYKMKPIIYTGESYYNDFLKKEFKEYPFWIANYNFWRKNPDEHWLLWQFTEKAKIQGIEGMVDVNVFNGDIVKLMTYTKPE